MGSGEGVQFLLPSHLCKRGMRVHCVILSRASIRSGHIIVSGSGLPGSGGSAWAISWPLAEEQETATSARFFFVRESAAGFNDLAQRTAQRFHTVGGVDRLANIGR